MLVNRVHKPFHCKICGSTSQIKVCKCQKVYYCSKNCQRIDWKAHKSDCFNLVDIPSTHRAFSAPSGPPNNGQISSGSQQVTTSAAHLQQQQQTNNIIACARAGQHESPSTQYQHMLETNTDNSNVENQACSTSTTADEFEENLFNSLLFTVDEGTEREILKNLDIGDEDLLKAVQIDDADSSFVFDDQSNSEAICIDTEEGRTIQSQQPTFDDEILEAIQRKKSFEYQPEAQRLLKETRENLEKELSMFREINLSEVKQQQEHESIVHSSADVRKIMGYKNNPKYQADGKLEDHLQGAGVDDQETIDEMCVNVIRDMNEFGVCVLDNFIGEDKGQKVLEEVKQMYTAGFFKDGQLVANKQSNRTNKMIRGDKIAWISGNEDRVSNIKHLMNQVDAVIMRANRMLNNGLMGQYKIRERTKAMVACYEGKGTHYVKHVDNPNSDGRCITCIYYLNADWDVRQSGGLLRIFPDGWEDRVADIEPIFDRITFFWSDRRNPHEVQPAHRTRYAITLWYFDANERENAVKRYQRECENLNLRKKMI